jgi:hypothetical protein
MNGDYHTAITVMPDGRVFAGEHDADRYPLVAAIANYKKDKKTGLIAKTVTNPKLSSLAGAIAKNPNGTMAALIAATTIANRDNLTHLQMLRLYPEAQGTPEPYFFLDEMFVPRDVPMLEAREPFYDTTATAQYLDRMEESKATKTVYDEIKYDLKKLVDKVYTPIEDIMRTIINPQTVDLSNVAFGFKYKRNLAALAALGKIGNTGNTLDNPATLDSTGFHSKYHVATELNEFFNTFWKTNDVRITHVAMNPTDFAEYAENTWTVSGPANLEPIRLAGGGVVPMPGIQGVTAVVDVSVPDDTIYAINKPNALRLGEGAKIMRRYYDEDRDAEAIKVIDFNQYLATAEQITKLTRKFGMTIAISDSG